eukprot:c4094_g1_i1.p1 GENE.c4094_g1_i1~~c4094_g1_i1.p1  ORF type:complete len:218 (+),score=25.64 c4094_g1_i1:76-654(+)
MNFTVPIAQLAPVADALCVAASAPAIVAGQAMTHVELEAATREYKVRKSCSGLAAGEVRSAKLRKVAIEKMVAEAAYPQAEAPAWAMPLLQLPAQLAAISHNSFARSVNSFATTTHPLVVLQKEISGGENAIGQTPVPDGTVFPATLSAIDGMTAANINSLQSWYNLPVHTFAGANIQQRRQKVRTWISGRI